MTNPYKLVIFDWEGTIADTLGQIIYIVEDIASQNGYPPIDANEARQMLSLGLVAAIKKLYPDLTPHLQQELLTEVQLQYSSKQQQLYLLPDAFKFIEQLHHAGVFLAIASNKGKNGLIKAVHLAGLEQFIPCIKSASESEAKPSPQMLEDILDYYAMDSKMALMIGDSVADIEMAQAVNMDSLGMDYYRQNGQALKQAGAKDVFDNYRQLAAYLGFNLAREY